MQCSKLPLELLLINVCYVASCVFDTGDDGRRTGGFGGGGGGYDDRQPQQHQQQVRNN